MQKFGGSKSEESLSEKFGHIKSKLLENKRRG